jgi:hypothetical protein
LRSAQHWRSAQQLRSAQQWRSAQPAGCRGAGATGGRGASY